MQSRRTSNPQHSAARISAAYRIGNSRQNCYFWPALVHYWTTEVHGFENTGRKRDNEKGPQEAILGGGAVWLRNTQLINRRTASGLLSRQACRHTKRKNLEARRRIGTLHIPGLNTPTQQSGENEARSSHKMHPFHPPQPARPSRYVHNLLPAVRMNEPGGFLP